MEIFFNILQILFSVSVFIIILSVIVLVHEFGHYFVAIKSGVRVDEFSLGFGNKLWGFKRGDTDYNIRIIPFGGFVKMFGEDDNETGPGSFAYAKLWQRMLIVLAGPFMNLVLSVFLLTFVFIWGAVPLSVMNDKANIDLAIEKGWTTELSFSDMQEGQKQNAIEFISKEQLEELKQKKFINSENIIVTSYWDQITKTNHFLKINLSVFSKVPWAYNLMGYSIEEDKQIFLRLNKMQKSLFGSFVFTLGEISRMSEHMIVRLGKLPAEILEKLAVPDDVRGPIGIAESLHEHVIPRGVIFLLQIMAYISLVLCIMNLLPIPALDGGRFVFQVVELILKPFKINISSKIESIIHFMSFVFLLILMIIVAGNDIMRIWEKI